MIDNEFWRTAEYGEPTVQARFDITLGIAHGALQETVRIKENSGETSEQIDKYFQDLIEKNEGYLDRMRESGARDYMTEVEHRADIAAAKVLLGHMELKDAGAEVWKD